MSSMLSSRSGGEGGGGTTATRRCTLESPPTTTTTKTTAIARIKRRDQLVIWEYICDCPRGGANDVLVAVNHDDIGNPNCLPPDGGSLVDRQLVPTGQRRDQRTGEEEWRQDDGEGGRCQSVASPLGKLVSLIFLDDDALYWTMS